MKKSNETCSSCNEDDNILTIHESWEYDELNKIQKLSDVTLLCSDCNLASKIGFINGNDELELALKKYALINNVSFESCFNDCDKAFSDWSRRNRIRDWTIDLSWLKNNGYDFLKK